MDFWNSLLTEKSWNLLQELKKKYNFVLIGGWAIYLWTKQHKSKDIDIVVNINELQKLKNEKLSKNDNLKKYEIKFDDIDVDIYVEYFSKLSILPEKIKKYSSKIESFDVAMPEALIVLKQGAEISRRDSIKGEKDRLDIISLLFFSDMNFNRYKEILKNCSLMQYINELILLVRGFENYDYFSMIPREFKLKKKEILNKLKKI